MERVALHLNGRDLDVVYSGAGDEIVIVSASCLVTGVAVDLGSDEQMSMDLYWMLRNHQPEEFGFL